MSDIHVLDFADDQKTINVIFHVPIPATGANVAGVLWKDSLVAFQGGAGAIKSRLQNIDPAELASMQAGTLFEFPTNIQFSSLGISDAQRIAELKTAFTQAKTTVLAQKQNQLNYYGYQTAGV